MFLFKQSFARCFNIIFTSTTKRTEKVFLALKNIYLIKNVYFSSILKFHLKPYFLKIFLHRTQNVFVLLLYTYVYTYFDNIID